MGVERAEIEEIGDFLEGLEAQLVREEYEPSDLREALSRLDEIATALTKAIQNAEDPDLKVALAFTEYKTKQCRKDAEQKLAEPE